jgi:hypothetical protein
MCCRSCTIKNNTLALHQPNQTYATMNTQAIDFSKCNAIDAESITTDKCRQYFGIWDVGLLRIAARKAGNLAEFEKDLSARVLAYENGKSEFCREYFAANFPHLLGCYMGKMLMGRVNEVPKKYQRCAMPF